MQPELGAERASAVAGKYPPSRYAAVVGEGYTPGPPLIWARDAAPEPQIGAVRHEQ